MDINVLQERIEKKQKQVDKIKLKIEKLEKTLNEPSELAKYVKKEYGYLDDRFESEYSRWENECIDYLSREIKGAKRDLVTNEDTLTKYKNTLEVEIQKANSIDNLPDIFTTFMNELVENWDEFDIARRDRIKNDVKQLSGLSHLEWRNKRKELIDKYGINFNDKATETNEHIHEQNVKDAKNIVLDLMNRVSAKTGEITDFSGLHLASSNQGFLILNGIVVGKEGTARVESILAGGYNIQRLHVRVLVK